MSRALSVICLISAFFGSFSALQSQTESTSKYWVFLSDKKGVEFDPYAYFDEKAIERREKLGLDLYDITDYPLNAEYVTRIKESVVEVTGETRWFNALAVMATSCQIELVSELPFVKGIGNFIQQDMELAQEEKESSYFDLMIDRSFFELLKAQTLRMGRQDFVKSGMDGENVRIAILDAGFKEANTNGCFEHIYKDNRLIDTYDFIKKNKNVYLGSSHGTAVWSCIAGITTEKDFSSADTLGLATGAEFLLARTEKQLFEVFSEEENWLAAVEWADKNGADIINSSLGYTGHRYTYPEMDGVSTLVSRAGNLAAKKGILVVNSAGNDGSSEWNFIGAPADADSVLAVGGILPSSGIHTSFSSVGPSFDYRIKPNVTAYGHVIGAKHNGLDETQGTSFSSPLTAGFAACAWQANPGWNNMELFHALEKGADLYPYYDYAHGFGVPLAKNFLMKANAPLKATHQLDVKDGVVEVTILIPSDNVDGEEVVDEEFTFGQFNINYALDYGDNLFYHFADAEGKLISYHVVFMDGEKEFTTDSVPVNTAVVRCYYNGFSTEYKLIN